VDHGRQFIGRRNPLIPRAYVDLFHFLFYNDDLYRFQLPVVSTILEILIRKRDVLTLPATMMSILILIATNRFVGAFVGPIQYRCKTSHSFFSPTPRRSWPCCKRVADVATATTTTSTSYSCFESPHHAEGISSLGTSKQQQQQQSLRKVLVRDF
jgi:hypothetical protein